MNRDQGDAIIWLVGGLVAGLLGLIVVFFAVKAHAHGPAEWIQRGDYKNAAGELCCGERDCFELADDDVKVTPEGYRVTLPIGQRAPGYIEGVNFEIVPFDQATPSPDGKYWRCQWAGERKCFFAPPGQS